MRKYWAKIDAFVTLTVTIQTQLQERMNLAIKATSAELRSPPVLWETLTVVMTHIDQESTCSSLACVVMVSIADECAYQSKQDGIVVQTKAMGNTAPRVASQSYDDGRDGCHDDCWYQSLIAIVARSPNACCG